MGPAGVLGAADVVFGAGVSGAEIPCSLAALASFSFSNNVPKRSWQASV